LIITFDMAAAPPTIERDSLWYKRGIIYEVHVRAFCDSNGDGIGDFPGLTSKLDYLRDLGVNALWLLPFYPSPLKDDGYDISNYCDVHPNYGTLADFKVFLKEAHRRGLRVITELVLNHTSDQHPWFQRARRSPRDSRFWNYYVWSDSADKYAGTRIIFKDTEASNWTWDRTASAFYWHRFFSHQPDLNFDNPEVHDELFKALDFWLDLGVDGMRLDAIPYLYEREGTSCENLPETHAFLRKLRAHVDEKYTDRMLLAEANQWPDDAATYFGTGRGTGCHMAFHFPLMPRLFMSLRMEDRVPIVDIMEQTPPIPETAQWALFLRNHDELTLEMVTDEERDYMYRMYAHVYQARLNLGIRRRLAPLLGNDRRRIELLNALLFSLPGTPVIYYGDEIGMGENIYLGDRNGVRTPMQWSADRNAGFSRANPQSLYLPINFDPENHYEAVNVDVQQRNPHSLLWWMRRLITLRQRWRAFGQGTLEFLQPENRKILACIRRFENETILIVANLSRFSQQVDLDLAPYKSLTPIELFGRTAFSVISDKPYSLSLGPHSFFWFSLEATGREGTSPGSREAAETRPVLSVVENWEEALDEYHQSQWERALREWLPSRRWFSGKNKDVRAVHVDELIPVAIVTEKAFIALVKVEFFQSEPEIYILPLAAAFGEQKETILHERPTLVIANIKVTNGNQEGVLYDAIGSRAFCRTLLEIFRTLPVLSGLRGSLNAANTPVLSRLLPPDGILEPNIGSAEQSNSSVVYGDKLILKIFRRVEPGTNPEMEIGAFFTSKQFAYTPSLAGAMEYRPLTGEPMTLAVLNTFVPGVRDAWSYTLDALSRFYERVQTMPSSNGQPPLPPATPAKMKAGELPPEVKELIGTYAESMRILGHRTAALHIALASDPENPAFAPEPFMPHYQRGLFQSMRNLTRQNFQLLKRKLKTLPADAQPLAQQVLESEPEILQRLCAIYEKSYPITRIRIHGDYHLGQVLYTGSDFLIIDFEGEPIRTISQRKLKACALTDVAGMLRSFDYASHFALAKYVEQGKLNPAQLEVMGKWGRFWTQSVSAVFNNAYREAAGTGNFLPADEQDLKILTDIFILRKAIYEIGYELGSRPDWVTVPLRGVLDILRKENSGATENK
jgi:maltose alpha-D-glucosyltransferase/alpha-amylase